MVERLGPTPFGHFTEKVQRTNAAADGIRRTYIRCLKWKNAAFDRHAETARKGGVWRYRELASSHEPFITMPDKLAEALLELASS